MGGTGFFFVDFDKTDKSGEIGHPGFSDFAVLFRTHFQGRIFSEVFASAGIPWQSASRSHALFRKGIPQIISFFKIIDGSGSFADLDRIIKDAKAGVGVKTLDAFKNWCYRNRFSIDEAVLNARRFPIPEMKPSSQLKFHDLLGGWLAMKTEVRGMGVEAKLLYIWENARIQSVLEADSKTREAFDGLLSVAKSFDDRTDAFLAHLALFTDTDAYDKRAEKVSLLTLHAAKGLEFPVVFVVGCDAGYLPYQGKSDRKIDIEEERRLFYVAMTRAKKRLYLTRAKQRRVFGEMRTMEISPFVHDIEQRLRSHETLKYRKAKKSGHKQLCLF